MEEILNIVKYQILSASKSDNILFDILSTITIIGIFLYISNKLKNINYDNFLNYMFKENKIIFICVENYFDGRHLSYDFSDNFLAINHYLANKLNINGITIGEISYQCYRDIYYINNNNLDFGYLGHKINIGNNIYCKYYKSEQLIIDKNYQIKHIIEISSTKSINILKKFIENIRNEYDEYKKNNNKNQYFINYLSKDYEKNIVRCRVDKFKSNKTFDNLFFDNKNEILENIKFFLNNEKWYKDKGFPYTLGIFLHGVPGCGKTSFIKALANLTNRSIINIDTKRIDTCDDLLNIFNCSEYNNTKFEIKQKIYVIEDIDCFGDIILSRDINENNNIKDNFQFKNYIDTLMMKDFNKNKLNLSFLLNLIDGVNEYHGRILIITTNYPEKIDKALLRPGRIDINVEFKKVSLNILKDMLKYYYPNFNEKKLQKYKNIDRKYTGAEILGIIKKSKNIEMFFNNFDVKRK